MRGRTSAACFVRLTLSILAATIAVSAQQQPVFRTETNFVYREVRARDAKGQFVSGLTTKDFNVYEDGVLQKITYFETRIGGRSVSTVASSGRPPVSNGLILPRTAIPTDISGRIFVVLIDDLNFLPLHSIQVRQVIGKLKRIIHENDLVGIVSSGYSSIQINPQYDIGYKRLEEAMSKTMGSGMDAQSIIQAPMTADGPAGLRYMAHTAMRTAHDLLEQFAQTPGRQKSIILISEGYDFDPYKDSRLKFEQERYGLPNRTGGDESTTVNPFQKTGNQFSEADLASDMSELIRAANRANTTIFAIDPRGLTAGPDINERVSITEYHDHIRTQTSSLQAIADNTGGFCICQTNDFEKGLDRIDNETSDYYMLGYTSSNPDPLKLRRFIRIEVKKTGVTLNYTGEYTLKRPSGKVNKIK
jgi:VWFA-related protein